MPKVSVGELVYLDRLQLIILSTDSNAEKYDKLLPGVYGPFRVFKITEHTLTVDEISIPNTISISRGTLVTRSINPPRCFKASETSSEDETTCHEIDS